jgi:hypothetical protein
MAERINDWRSDRKILIFFFQIFLSSRIDWHAIKTREAGTVPRA